MRVVLQIAKDAEVKVNEEVIGSIPYGFLLLVGFTHGDTFEVIDKMAEKIVKLRIFPDENGKTNLSLKDVGGKILSVSQFTLYADTKKGNRPSFVSALGGEASEKLYDYFNEKIVSLVGEPISKGKFGADMKVRLTNDGPFTLVLDSKELF